MKKMLLVPFVAAFALATLAACGDSSSNPTKKAKSEECALRASAECLVGSWSLVGLANATNENQIIPNFDYSTGPGKLTFTEDGKFEFDLPTVNLGSSPLLNPLDYPVYGDWKIEAGIIKLHSMSTALFKTRVERAAIITIDGAEVKMTFGPGSLWLMENATDETSIKANATEVYTIK
jgi:hypothetical protein